MLRNLEVIDIKLSNYPNKDINFEQEISTKLFNKINSITSNIDLDRLSGIIVITDGQIHDFDSYNKLLSEIPIHYILVGNKNENDRILLVQKIRLNML